MNGNVQHIARSLLILVVFIILYSCSGQEVTPINIYETETLDPASARTFKVQGLGDIFVNQGRFIKTATGVNIKGTIFTHSISGLIPVSSGEFSLSDPISGVYSNLEGYGLGSMPNAGFLGEFEPLINPASFISFRSGAAIREEEPEVPLQKDKYYLVISPDPLLEKTPIIKAGSSRVFMSAVYLDPKDPSIYFQGEVDGDVQIEDLGMGLSANGLLIFEPYEYSKALESAMIRPLEPFNGNILMKGEIPLENYQVNITGEAVVGFVLNGNGAKEFFENGFEKAAFRMGANGTVSVNHTLLDYMPVDIELEMGKSTLILNTEQENENFLQVAGRMNKGDLAGKLLADLDPSGFLENIQFQGNVLECYLYVSDNIQDTQFYISNTLFLSIPGIGEHELTGTLLEITAGYIRAEGRMGIPGLGKVSLKGQFFYDGRFLLAGEASVKADLEVVSLEIKVEVFIGNDGFKLVTTKAVCLTEGLCEKVLADVSINWDTGEMKVCADIPGAGEKCTTLQ